MSYPVVDHSLHDATASKPVLEVRNLSITLPSEAGAVHAVTDLSFDLHPGRVLGVVGESGSGKSMTSLAIMGLLPASASVKGSITYASRQLIGLSDGQMSRLRGNRIALVPQDPLSSLTPVLTVGHQLIEAILTHQSIRRDIARERAIDLLDRVGIPAPRRAVDSFPHQFSGGMRQRVLIAMAIANDPEVIIADEPTTALDVTVQAQILDVLRDVQAQTHAAMILVTHDLGVVAGMADEVMVMRRGRLVEHGTAQRVLTEPRDAYTRDLLSAVPRIDGPLRARESPAAGDVPMVMEMRGVKRYFARRSAKLFARRDKGAAVKAVDGVSIRIERGETFALVGESGSGKSTTIREIMRLEPPMAGEIVIFGQDVAHLAPAQRADLRSRIQIVFQDPLASLDPRMPIAEILAEPLVAAGGWTRSSIHERVQELLTLVELDPERYMERFPGELSGGQRQRIAIARAIALNPELIVLDEPVSALDVTVQRSILQLLKNLQDTLDLSYLFVSHDLAVVRELAHRVGVMYLGRVVEQGAAADVLGSPRHPYTRALLSAVPLLDPAVERGRARILLEGDLPSPDAIGDGCRFVARCPLHRMLPAADQERCRIDPVSETPVPAWDVACHFPERALAALP